MTRLTIAGSGLSHLAYGAVTGWLALNIILLGVSEIGIAFGRRG